MRFVTPVLRLPLSSSKFPTQSHFKMLNIFRWCLKLGARVCSGASGRFRELTGQISTSSEGKRWLFPPQLPEDVEWERPCVCVCVCVDGIVGVLVCVRAHTHTHTHERWACTLFINVHTCLPNIWPHLSVWTFTQYTQVKPTTAK